MSGEEEDSTRFKQMEKERKESKTELDELQRRVGRLTVGGAIVLPVSFLFVALLAVGVGIGFYYEENPSLVGASTGVATAICILTFYIFYKILSTVEHAILRPSRTIGFEVCYGTRQKTAKCKVGKALEPTITVKPIEEDVKNTSIFILFPPEIEILAKPTEARVTLQPDWAEHAGFTLVHIEKAFLPCGLHEGLPFTILPKKIGTYTIYVQAQAEGVRKCKAELTVEVVE